MSYLIWIPALMIAVRALCVAYNAHYPSSGRSVIGFGLFGYSYALLAFGALICAAELTSCAGDLDGFGRPALLIAAAGLIVTDRRYSKTIWTGVAERIASCFKQ